ncbi:MAG TPA: YdeI/OmpD-associated family protein [Terriglobales bacterium]|nr:YdeI/OmpD-associated family protein [Terriglobales bacterium]
MRTFYASDRNKWRAWLERNGQSAKEIWLVYYKKNSGKPRLPYGDAVEEAICFGWIDGVVKKIDDERFAQKFTPRKPSSRWSKLNIGRARKVIREGMMTAPGLAVFHPANEAAPHPTEMPKELEALFEKQKQAWANFQNFPPYYRRMTIAWVSTAKKEETRQKRLQQLIKFSARNERIKFM